jgi:hypothetical protein
MLGHTSSVVCFSEGFVSILMPWLLTEQRQSMAERRSSWGTKHQGLWVSYYEQRIICRATQESSGMFNSFMGDVKWFGAFRVIISITLVLELRTISDGRLLVKRGHLHVEYHYKVRDRHANGCKITDIWHIFQRGNGNQICSGVYSRIENTYRKSS